MKITNLSHVYRSGSFWQTKTTALTEINWEVPQGQITGLFGPNGSGKSTLMQAMAGFIIPTQGQVTIAGESVLTSPNATRQVHLAREGSDSGGFNLRRLLEIHATLRPSFDLDFARHLSRRMEVPEKKEINRLSRGKKSCVAGLIALASRTPITILDEVQLGMDVPTRYLFTEELLADQAANPRTYVISSHLVSELETVVENVVLLDRGRIVRQASTDEFCQHAGARRPLQEAFLDALGAHEDPINQVYAGSTVQES